MNNHFFSRTGRLTRRDYALRIGVLFGATALALHIAFYFLVPAAYTAATAFFREATAAFWIFLIIGFALIITLVYTLFPLLAIPATVRRLHDIGCSGSLAFPLLFAGLIPIGLPMLALLFLAGVLEMMNLSPDLIFFDSPEEVGLVLGSFAFVYIFLVFIGIFVLALFSAWIFLKKGDPVANRYGEPPVEEELPPVRAAYFPTQGTIARTPFIMRSLLLLAAAAILVPSLIEATLYPVVLMLDAMRILPTGLDFFVLLLSPNLFPLALLPLILCRLRTLGRSKWEAALTCAPFLPCLLLSWKISAVLGELDRVDYATPLDSTPLYDYISISSDGNSFLIALSILCGILALIGITRLLHRDAEYDNTSSS